MAVEGGGNYRRGLFRRKAVRDRAASSARRSGLSLQGLMSNQLKVKERNNPLLWLNEKASLENRGEQFWKGVGRTADQPRPMSREARGSRGTPFRSYVNEYLDDTFDAFEQGRRLQGPSDSLIPQLGAVPTERKINLQPSRSLEGLMGSEVGLDTFVKQNQPRAYGDIMREYGSGNFELEQKEPTMNKVGPGIIDFARTVAEDPQLAYEQTGIAATTPLARVTRSGGLYKDFLRAMDNPLNRTVANVAPGIPSPIRKGTIQSMEDEFTRDPTKGDYAEAALLPLDILGMGGAGALRRAAVGVARSAPVLGLGAGGIGDAGDVRRAQRLADEARQARRNLPEQAQKRILEQGNDLNAREAVKNKLETHLATTQGGAGGRSSGGKMDPVVLSDEEIIPTLAYLHYGVDTFMDAGYALGMSVVVQHLRNRGVKLAVQLMDEGEAKGKIIEVGESTQARTGTELVSLGARIPVGERKIDGKTFGLGMMEYTPHTSFPVGAGGEGVAAANVLEPIQGVYQISDKMKPFKKGFMRLVGMVNDGRLNTEYLPASIDPDAEALRGISMLRNARGGKIPGARWGFVDENGAFVRLGGDEVDHNPVGQRALLWASAEFLNKTRMPISKAEDEVATAYAILSTRLDLVPGPVNQGFGSWIRTGQFDDPAYQASRELGASNMIQFLDEQGQLFSIHADNWALLQEHAPHIAKYLKEQMKNPPPGVNFGNKRAVPGQLHSVLRG